jgi:DNA-binding NarL/FixJ family response regulator
MSRNTVVGLNGARDGFPAGDTSVTRPRVVLAENHPAMASKLHELLASEYDIVAVVQDGAALVDAVERDSPDAIVSDIAMPGVNGFVAAASILEVQPAARIVFVSVMESHAIIDRALDCGALGYVLKRDVGHELVPAVRRAIDGEQYVSANARVALAKASFW